VCSPVAVRSQVAEPRDPVRLLPQYCPRIVASLSC
jgi:hypothetical protein